MARKLLFALCALALLLGAGQAAGFLRTDTPAELVRTAEQPELKTLIGTGVWWGKSETLERDTAEIPAAAEGAEKI